MLSHLAQASRQPARSWLSTASRRCYAAKAEAGSRPDPFQQGPSYAKWLRGDGAKFKDAHRPRNWLGGEVPFPLNPSFKPPRPISNELRTTLWDLFMMNPETNSVRSLSERYGISMQRVDAILRLKGLEQQWIKNKPLQTGFLAGMEYSLGVTAENKTWGRVASGADELGRDAVEADAQSETMNAARGRYQRLYWEPVVEGQDPITPKLVAKASQDGARYSKEKEAARLKQLDGLKFETEPEVVLERGDRPTLRFVDVGVKYVDVHDRLKRVNAATRRSALKRRRRTPSAGSTQPRRALATS